MNETTIKRIEQAAVNLAEVAVKEYQNRLHERLTKRANAIEKALRNEIPQQMEAKSNGLQHERYQRNKSILYAKMYLLYDIDWMAYETLKQMFAE